MELAGKSAIVTGGASGLGLATVAKLVERGVVVVIADLASSAGETKADEFGDMARFVPTDVTSESDVQAAVKLACEVGDLAVVVNCAGIGSAVRTVGRSGAFPLDHFRKVVEVNLVGTFNVIRLAAEAMAARECDDEERGVIVNTASVAAFDGQIGQVAYAASKSGVAGMTLPIARDLAQFKIRVNTIAPGLFLTPLFETLAPETIATLEADVPHPKRLGRPDEYADLALSIITNPMLNGETIRLDGAIRMAPR